MFWNKQEKILVDERIWEKKKQKNPTILKEQH